LSPLQATIFASGGSRRISLAIAGFGIGKDNPGFSVRDQAAVKRFAIQVLVSVRQAKPVRGSPCKSRP
jgi:hypothetical protein